MTSGLLDVLEYEGIDGFAATFQQMGGHLTGSVDLIWERATAVEALEYALTLLQLGREVEAAELVELVTTHGLKAPCTAQAGQRQTAVLLP